MSDRFAKIGDVIIGVFVLAWITMLLGTILVWFAVDIWRTFQ